jgi:calcineurin-like phosphoesterase family protein
MKREKQIWFTSDSHFSHKNIIRFSNRPFKDENHMNEELIRAWNEVVDEDDDVYHLGDVSLSNDPEVTHKILQRLNGNIHLIKGNHEKSVLSKSYNIDRFVWVKDYYELKIKTNEANLTVPTKNKEQLIVMCHYGMRVWNKSHHGSYMLYGHSHDSMEKEPWGRSMDVGVDSAYRILGAYRPFSLDEITKIMSTRTHNPIDHHVEQQTIKHNVNLKRNL